MDSCGSANEKNSDDKKRYALSCAEIMTKYTGTLTWEQEVYIVVARDLIHQTALEDRQPVAETNDDVAPEVLLCFEEQTVRVFGRMLRRESS